MYIYCVCNHCVAIWYIYIYILRERERESASKITLGCMPANGIVRPLARDRRNECMCVRCSHRKKRHLQSSSAAELHNRSAIHIYMYTYIIHVGGRWRLGWACNWHVGHPYRRCVLRLQSQKLKLPRLNQVSTKLQASKCKAAELQSSWLQAFKPKGF